MPMLKKLEDYGNCNFYPLMAAMASFQGSIQGDRNVKKHFFSLEKTTTEPVQPSILRHFVNSRRILMTKWKRCFRLTRTLLRTYIEESFKYTVQVLRACRNGQVNETQKDRHELTLVHSETFGCALAQFLAPEKIEVRCNKCGAEKSGHYVAPLDSSSFQDHESARDPSSTSVVRKRFPFVKSFDFYDFLLAQELAASNSTIYHLSVSALGGHYVEYTKKRYSHAVWFLKVFNIFFRYFFLATENVGSITMSERFISQKNRCS